MAPTSIETNNVLDVFQRGLRRGAARLPFAPHKRYFYVEHPQEGWRVYLRSVCFLHDSSEPFKADHFLVVKRTGGDPVKASWEPPKGQMEGRDAPKGIKKSVLQLLKENIRREVEEEAKISRIRDLWHTDLVLQAVEPDFPPNTYFQYHIFQGQAHPKEILRSRQEFEWYAEHPAAFEALRADQKEKDAIAWSDEEPKKKMMGRWSPTLARLYLERFSEEDEKS